MARYKRHRGHHRKSPPESRTANKISWGYGGPWWLVKKVLLILSVITDIAVIVLLVIHLAKGQKVLLSGVGIAAGLLLMAWALGSVSRFKVSVLRAVMIPVITAIYAVFFLGFTNSMNI